MAQVTKWLAGLAAALIAILAGLNWSTLTIPTSLNLLFAQVQAPFGVILFTVGALFVLLFYIATFYDRFGRLLENRRLLKEIDVVRSAAKGTDAARIDELNKALTSELQHISERLARLEARLLSGSEKEIGPASGHQS